MYVMVGTKLNIYYALCIMNIYKSNIGPNHQVALKHMLKYLYRKKDYVFVYLVNEQVCVDQISHLCKDSYSYMSRYEFALIGRVVNWKNIKQSRLLTQLWKLDIW